MIWFVTMVAGRKESGKGFFATLLESPPIHCAEVRYGPKATVRAQIWK